jgi:hypothetical protein
MSDIEVSMKSTFVILSAVTSKTADHFNRFFRPHFPNNPVIFHRHYSSRGTDQEWLESMCNLLGIEADYQSIIKNYKQNDL